MDPFVVPTISFRLLYGLLIVGHGRPSQRIRQQKWIATRYLIRDRDGAYGKVFIRRVRSMGIRDRLLSPRSPWQNGYAERLIGSIRRECLDHVVVFGARHLRHVLQSYMNYCNETRTHLSLDKVCPRSGAAA
jgi:transposase InsO family protein